MCPGWRTILGRCCGVFLLLLILFYPPHANAYPAVRGKKIDPWSDSSQILRNQSQGIVQPRPLFDPHVSPILSFQYHLNKTIPSNINFSHPIFQKFSKRNYSSYIYQNLIETFGRQESPGELLSTQGPILSEDPLRSPRSAFGNSTRVFRDHHRMRFQLYSYSANSFLKFLPNGTITLTTDENDPYSLLNIESLQLEQPYSIRFQAMTTGQHLCMNKRGRLYGHCYQSTECEFLSRIEKSYYTSFESKRYKGRFMAAHNNKIRKSKKMKRKHLKDIHYFLEFRRPIVSAENVLINMIHNTSFKADFCKNYRPNFVKYSQNVQNKNYNLKYPKKPFGSTSTASTMVSKSVSNSSKRRRRKCRKKKCRRRKCKTKLCRQLRRKRRKGRRKSSQNAPEVSQIDVDHTKNIHRIVNLSPNNKNTRNNRNNNRDMMYNNNSLRTGSSNDKLSNNFNIKKTSPLPKQHKTRHRHRLRPPRPSKNRHQLQEFSRTRTNANSFSPNGNSKSNDRESDVHNSSPRSTARRPVHGVFKNNNIYSKSQRIPKHRSIVEPTSGRHNLYPKSRSYQNQSLSTFTIMKRKNFGKTTRQPFRKTPSTSQYHVRHLRRPRIIRKPRGRKNQSQIGGF